MIRVGILGPSEIAFRRFLPALVKTEGCEYAGVAVATIEERKIIANQEATEEDVLKGVEKGNAFVRTFGGMVYSSYEHLLNDASIDAIYLPLPPALHYYWAKKALEAGKHVLVEKPFTTSLRDTCDLIRIAQTHNLALHENYMFIYHSQLEKIEGMLAEGRIGEVRLFRTAFGFPQRASGDFRYSKALGGGALFDCGGYPIKLARRFLGKTAELKYGELQYKADCEVDIAGSGICSDGQGLTVQIAFGMDNAYKCELEVWGSKGRICTNRIFTAPMGYQPTLEIETQDGKESVLLEADDTFYKSIQHFIYLIEKPEERMLQFEEIVAQARTIDNFANKLN